jgi:hypothetical protein
MRELKSLQVLPPTCIKNDQKQLLKISLSWSGDPLSVLFKFLKITSIVFDEKR